MKPSDLLKILSVPGGDEPLSLVVSHCAGREPYSGWVEDLQGRTVGRLDAFRFSFVNFAPATDAERAHVLAKGPVQIKIPTYDFVDAMSSRIYWKGKAIEVGGYLKGFHGEDLTAFFEFQSNAPRIELGLHAHGWSGIAVIEVDGKIVEQVDLFNQETALLRRVPIENSKRSNLTIRVRPTERAAPASQGRQLLLEGIFEYTENLVSPTYHKHPSRNRGGEFRPEFFEVLKSLGPDATVLDVGGGKRQIDDYRYLNLEYSRYEEPDLYGDGMALPFRSNSIDFVYTAAVLEHVRNPLKMGAEIHRVLKPGGRVLAAGAFMQPVHSEGQHFFNITPYGIELIFEAFQTKRVWWEPSFTYTMDWLINVSGVRGIAEESKIRDFLSLAGELEVHIPYDRAMYLASCVWLDGSK